MMFNVIECAQKTPEWFAARAGRLTGSRASDMLSTIKSGEAAARRDYRMQLVCERLTGQPQEDGYVNAAMQRGIDLEPAALAAYESLTGSVVVRTGFLAHRAHRAGCSLDGSVDDFQGIVEVKCPKSSTHVGYLREGVVPRGYLAQITHNLWITGARWCDFLSFDDRLPLHLQVFLVRVHLKDGELAAYESRALQFLAEVEDEYQALKEWSSDGI